MVRSDGDGVGITRMSLNDSTESVFTDGDGKGNNADNDDDNHGYTDVHETSECYGRETTNASSRPRDFDQDGICDSITMTTWMVMDGFMSWRKNADPTGKIHTLGSRRVTDGDGRCNGMDNDDDGDGMYELRCSTDPLDANCQCRWIRMEMALGPC